LEFGAEGNESFGFAEAGFELADASGVVCPFGFEDADFGA
jgi:hypothetical protein